MSHSYVSALFHCVFSTKERRPLITPDLETRLWPYMCGIAREQQMKIVEIGGTKDHIHFLLSLPATISLSKALQTVKGCSSKWVHDTFLGEHRGFAWQEGYGAFSIGISQTETTLKYIRNQKTHHAKVSFEDEFKKILERHWITYDEKYIFG